MKSKRILILIQALLLVVSILTASWLFDNWMISGPHGPYRWVGMDFASYWVGVKDMIYGIDPYSPETTLRIQHLIYGGPALGEDPMLFSYPAWLFLLVAPFALIPYKLASVIWVGGLLWAILNLRKKLQHFWEIITSWRIHFGFWGSLLEAYLLSLFLLLKVNLAV